MKTVPAMRVAQLLGFLLLPSCAMMMEPTVSYDEVITPPVDTRALRAPLQAETRPAAVEHERHPHRGATAAVMNLETCPGVTPEEASLLSDRLAIELTKAGVYTVTSRTSTRETLQSQAYPLSCRTTDAAASAGKVLGADYVIYGSIGHIGSIFTVNAYVSAVQDGTTAVATVDCRNSIEEMLTVGMGRLATSLLRASAAMTSSE